MPSNLIQINGSGAKELNFELSDSKMPALMQFLSTFTRVPEEGDALESQFGKLMREIAKAHYGEDFEFSKCAIEIDVEKGIDITTFDLKPGSDMEAQEPIQYVDTAERSVQMTQDEAFEVENAVRELLCKGVRKRKPFTDDDLDKAVADSVGQIMVALKMHYPDIEWEDPDVGDGELDVKPTFASISLPAGSTIVGPPTAGDTEK